MLVLVAQWNILAFGINKEEAFILTLLPTYLDLDSGQWYQAGVTGPLVSEGVCSPAPPQWSVAQKYSGLNPCYGDLTDLAAWYWRAAGVN